MTTEPPKETLIEGGHSVTVMVSIELLAQLEHDWSSPVEIQIQSTPDGTGYVMNARTHTCEQDVIEVGTRLGFELGKAEGRKQAGEEIAESIEGQRLDAPGIPHERTRGWNEALKSAAEIARNLTSQPQEATSEPLTAPTQSPRTREEERPGSIRIPGGEG